jgi:integrase
MQKLVHLAEGQHKALSALQFATGMRIGEMCGLQVEDLDFEDNLVHIRRSTFRHVGVTSKRKAGYREVDVDPATMSVIRSSLAIVRVEGSSRAETELRLCRAT